MANYRGINTNNYSDLSGWEVSTDGGINWTAAVQLPTISDGVYANGFIKNVDVNSFAAFYSNRPSVNVIAGGRFNINSGVTMVGDVLHRHVTSVIACVYKNNVNNSWIVGDIYGSDLLTTQSGGFASTNYSHGTLCAQGTIIVVGDCYGGFRSENFFATDRFCTGLSTVTLGSAIITGNAYAQRNANTSIGVASLTSKSISLFGRAVGLGLASGAYEATILECENKNQNCTVTSKFIMPITNSSEWINCLAQTGAPVQIEIYDEAGNAVLCNPIAAQGQASPADVRLGTAYANGALTGTLAVPNPATVSLGVPTDNTTGTLPTSAVVATDLLNEIATSSIPLAERLRNVATTSTVNSAVGSINVIP